MVTVVERGDATGDWSFQILVSYSQFHSNVLCISLMKASGKALSKID
jgi:hypothetical protein